MSNEKLEQEIDNAIKNPDFGIATDELIAFAARREIKWRMREDGHTKAVRDQLIKISDDYKFTMKKFDEVNRSRAEKEAIYEKCTKKILELSLVDFDYEKYANDARVGPQVLGILANHILHFFVEIGGRDVSKHLQTLQHIDTLNRLRSTRRASRNGKRLSGTKTGSGR